MDTKKALIVTTLCFSTLISGVINAAGTAEEGFDAVCQIFNQVSSGKSALSAEDYTEISEKVWSDLDETNLARISWTAISSAEEKYRYELMQGAASSSGIDSWKCPAMEVMESASKETER